MSIRHTIAEEVLRSGWLEQQCRSVCSNQSLVDDLMGEVLLIILEYKPQSALDSAYKENNHLALIRRVITNQWRSNTSPFYAKYRKHQLLQCEYNNSVSEIEENDEE